MECSRIAERPSPEAKGPPCRTRQATGAPSPLLPSVLLFTTEHRMGRPPTRPPSRPGPRTPPLPATAIGILSKDQRKPTEFPWSPTGGMGIARGGLRGWVVRAVLA
ncbi:hypothetical protein GCM10009799_43560 [Nocardiopsis rhodophaea]|uniref:Uncharacterized protein n=1 Tax=Nocardiopsis rhodophaea TaxID=280238 RepID=A0ABN2TJD2_9ACTN